MKGLGSTNWRCRESLPPTSRPAAPAIAVLLAPFATGLPPELIDPLRSVASELGLPESLIAAVAIALFLDGEGF